MEFLTPDIVPVLSIGIALAALIATLNWRNNLRVKDQFDSINANWNQRFEALEKLIEASEARSETRHDKFETKLGKRLTEFEAKIEKHLTESEAKFDARLTEIETKFDARLAESETKFDARLTESEAKFDERLTESETKLNDRQNALETKVDTNQIKLETKIFDLDKQMTHLAGLLEGLREAVVGRRAA